jgi:hypothetical protein
MSQSHPHSQPILTSVAAHLYVRDLKAFTDFFTTALKDTSEGLRGFEITDPDAYILFFGG